MRSTLRSFIGLSAVTFLTFSTAFAAENLVQIQVHPGESLMDVVHRVHPCPVKANDRSLQQVLRYNPETVGKDGNFVLTQKEISVPASFMESAKSCREVASVVSEKPKALLQAEGHEAGGGEAVATEPKEISEREHGEEAHSQNVVRLGTFLEYSKLSATSSSGSAADLTSKPEYGLDIEYDRWINRSLFLGAHYRYAHSAFQELEGRELKEDQTHAQSMGVTAGYDLGKKTFFTLDLSGVQIDHVTQFVDDDGVSIVAVDHIWVPRLTFGIKSIFAEVAGFELGAGLAGSLYLPAKGVAKTSPAENAEVFVERELNSLLSVELGFGAQFVRQGFIDGSQSYTSYGADLGIGIHF